MTDDGWHSDDLTEFGCHYRILKAKVLDSQTTTDHFFDQCSALDALFACVAMFVHRSPLQHFRTCSYSDGGPSRAFSKAPDLERLRGRYLIVYCIQLYYGI